MTGYSEEFVSIEEVEIEKPGTNPWLVIGAIAALIAVVFGVRAVRKRARASQPATPTADLPD